MSENITSTLLNISPLNSLHIIAYLSNSFFKGNKDIARITIDYLPFTFMGEQEFVIFSLVEKTIGKNKSEHSNELTAFLSKKIQIYPSFAKYNINNPEHTKKICLFMQSESSLDWNTQLIAGLVLASLNRLHRINKLDVISQEEIAEEDLFIAENGQRFSVTYLVDYHNNRSYRKSEGEQHGQKFLLNPITNNFFPFRDALGFIFYLVEHYPNKELFDLSDDTSYYGLSLHAQYSDYKARMAKYKTSDSRK